MTTRTVLIAFLLMCLTQSLETFSSEAITFLEEGSFLELDAFSTGFLTAAEVARSGISFEFSFMTESVTAILVYAAASEPNQAAQQQMSSIQSPHHLHPAVSQLSLHQQQLFIAAEVINGKTVLSMNDGSGVVTLHSEAIVNDGVWHRVNAIFSSSHMEVNVDGKSKFLRPSSSSDISGIPVAGSAKMPKTLFDQIDFTSVYIGGMHRNREYNALQQNIQSLVSEGSVPAISLVGCVKEMKVNRKVIGIKSSSGTSSGTCGWKFMCILSEPCIEEATCFQDGLDGFNCLCDHPPCEKSQNQSQEGRTTGINSLDLHHGPEINVYAERGSDYDKEREVSKRVQAGGAEQDMQPNYRQRNHHRGRGSSTSATAVAGSSASPSSSSSSSSSSSTAASLSPTSSPSLTLTKGILSLASAAQGNSGKGSAFPVNHVSVGWKQHDPADPGETNLIQQQPHQSFSSSTGTTSVRHPPSPPPPLQQAAHPASFISYLGTVISKEQAITCFIIAVISLIAIVFVAMVRGFYLYGRRKELNRRQSHKDLNLCSSNNSSSGGGSCSGGRKDSETTTSACTPLPLGSDFDDPCSELLSPPSDLLSPPSLSSRLNSDFPEPQQQLAPIVHPPVHSYSTFGRSINRRDSSLFLPLPPPSFYFTNNSSSFSDLPASPFRFSEYRD